ncbi:MAG: 50S ribosomal protein L18 [Bacteroidales bacterium]|nr:50S ribosomal protein L18 [Bacteroidales bacterium]
MALTKQERRIRIKKRIRGRVAGTADIPRMSVFRSNKQIYVQLINDKTGETLLSIGSTEKELVGEKGVNKTDQAKIVGKKLAEKALEKGITEVVFDRNGYLYHGRVKSLADAARENGLKF